MKKNRTILFISSFFIFVLVINNLIYNTSKEYLRRIFLMEGNEKGFILISVKNTIIYFVAFAVIYLFIRFILSKITKKNCIIKNNLPLIQLVLSIILLISSLVIIGVNYKNYKLTEKEFEEIETLYFIKHKKYDGTAKNKKTNYLYKEGYYSFPTPEKAVKFEIDTLGKEIPETKDDGSLNVIINVIVDDYELKTYGTIKVQGTSTAKWPKKNWTIKLYNDMARTKEISLKIGESVFSDKWVAKADYVDVTQVRNHLSYSIYGEMARNRTSDKLEVENSSISNIGAQGYPKTYASVIDINDEHYGIYTFLIGHDPANFNIDKTNREHLYFEFDARNEGHGFDETYTWEKFNSKYIGKWIHGYYPMTGFFTRKQKDAIDRLGEFVNGDLENFKENFDQYLDKENIFDMMILQEVVYDWDAKALDLEIVTYDLEKWYILPWDKDQTFGLFRDEFEIKEDTKTNIVFDYKKEDPEEKPWFKTYTAFTDEFEARYAKLRDEILTEKNIEKIILEFYDHIDDELWVKEFEKWEEHERPTEKDKYKEVISWFNDRIKVLDEIYNYK